MQKQRISGDGRRVGLKQGQCTAEKSGQDDAVSTGKRLGDGP